MDNKRVVLPPEILYEILENLPVKTLIRFRCVCKSWNYLFSDSSFQQEHYLRRLQQDPVILIASTSTDCVDQDIHPDTLDLFIHGANARTDMDNYCQVFTLGTSHWREARCSPPDSFSDLSFHAPFFHGAIHFLSDSEYHSANDAIYAFDTESEEYTTIQFPEDYYFAGEEGSVPEWTWQCLNEFKGCLYLTSNFETSMHLWLLKDYASGKWVKEYIIDLPEMSSEFVWGEPLAITSDGNILLKLNEELRNGQLYWYNPSDKTFEETMMEDYTATMYVESLFPLAF